MNEPFNYDFMEHAIYLLHLLEQNQVEIDMLSADSSQMDFLSQEDLRELRVACDLMDKTPGGILICQADDNQQILYANQETLRIMQCATIKDLRDLTGNSFWGIIHPEDLDMIDRTLSLQSFNEGEPLPPMEYRILRSDETDRWVEDYRRLVRCEKIGDAFFLFITDVTDKRKIRQQELDNALERANTAVVAKNAFLTNISHDIRTPLNAIFGFTSLAKNSLQDTEALVDYLNRIETASKKLLDMVSQVLEVTALSTAEKLTEVECDLRAMGQEVYDFLRPHAQEKNISYTLDCSSIKHSGIYADQEKLKQMMLNLVNNAITYTNPGGSVSMTIEEGDELPGQEATYYIVVSDTGIGISKEFIDHIFEPFSREKNSTLSGVHNIGLGLTIVKTIVDKMGGTIDAKSVENQGSTFTATLHFRTQPLPDTSAEETETAQSKQTILLVEDNEFNREIETELLEKMNFAIVPAENGYVALQKMQQAAPGDYDLILMDLQMPVMDGWETSAAIRKLPDPALANIPIIALSASIFLTDYQKSEESGINVHLAKPLNLPVLLETIEELTKQQ